MKLNSFIVINNSAVLYGRHWIAKQKWQMFVMNDLVN